MPDRSEGPSGAREPETTAEIVDAIRGGDRERFGGLYARSAPALAVWAAVRIPAALRSRLDPEDLAQEVWSRAFARFATFDPALGPFRAWLFGIARHVLLQTFRTLRERLDQGSPESAHVIEDVPDDVTSLSRRLARSDDVRRIVAQVATLDDGERMLFLRHGIEGAPLGEIAAELGITREAAKKRWMRLRERIAAHAEAGDVLAGEEPG